MKRHNFICQFVVIAMTLFVLCCRNVTEEAEVRPSMDVCELSSNAEKYDGVVVTVRGRVSGFHQILLSDSRCPGTSNMILLDLGYSDFTKLAQKTSSREGRNQIDGNIIVTGRFSKKGGHVLNYGELVEDIPTKKVTQRPIDFEAPIITSSRIDSFVETDAGSPLDDSKHLPISPGVSRQFEDGLQILGQFNKILTVNTAIAIEKARSILGVAPQTLDSLVLCDAGLTWRVIDKDNLKEIRIDKVTGHLNSTPLSLRENMSVVVNPAPIGKIDAFKIVKAHYDSYGQQFGDVHASDGYFPSICDLNDYWRIYFVSYELKTVNNRNDIAKLANNHAPDYLVEKATGRITYFSGYTKRR